MTVRFQPFQKAENLGCTRTLADLQNGRFYYARVFTVTTKQDSNIYLLTQARYLAAMQLMWAYGTTAYGGLMPSELPPSTHLQTSKGWTAQLAAGLRFVVPAMGFELTQVEPTRFETMRLFKMSVISNHGSKRTVNFDFAS